MSEYVFIGAWVCKLTGFPESSDLFLQRRVFGRYLRGGEQTLDGREVLFCNRVSATLLSISRTLLILATHSF